MTRNAPPLPALDAPPPTDAVAVVADVVDDPVTRLRRMVDGHYGAVWRTVRFLGVPDATAEDAAQQVFCIAARRLAEVTPGAERAFLLATAWRVASESRRAARRRPPPSDSDVNEVEASLPSPEDLVDQKRARAALHSVLSAMPADLRMVFVLYEIEELTLPEIAVAVGAPLGTVTSRLRRARDEFQRAVKRRNAAAISPARKGSP
jgi:RNA polymerase sigma-70 factor (ECF subfamily)